MIEGSAPGESRIWYAAFFLAFSVMFRNQFYIFPKIISNWHFTSCTCFFGENSYISFQSYISLIIHIIYHIYYNTNILQPEIFINFSHEGHRINFQLISRFKSHVIRFLRRKWLNSWLKQPNVLFAMKATLSNATWKEQAVLILQAIDLLRYTKFFLFLFHWNALNQLIVWCEMRDHLFFLEIKQEFEQMKYGILWINVYMVSLKTNSSNNLIKLIPDEANLNESVACVFKTAWFFYNSIRENISRGKLKLYSIHFSHSVEKNCSSQVPFCCKE